MTKNEVIRQENSLISTNTDIKTMIYEIRGQRVMLDSDLAMLYGYEVKRLNEQVQRNIERFPNDFMFKLSFQEVDLVRSQIATSRDSSLFKGQDGGRRYLPYVFTEQGVYALSGILRGSLATTVSINLIRAFKELKDFYNNNSYLLDKVIDIETKQETNNLRIEEKFNDYDKQFDTVFNYISKHKKENQKIFYKGQIYEAYSLLVDLVNKANKSIILIDNYIDKITLDILSKKKDKVKIKIYTSKCYLSDTDISKFNEEYNNSLIINYVNSFHDRFLILDNKTSYLIGASIKDAGKKGFAIVKLDNRNIIKEIINKLNIN